MGLWRSAIVSLLLNKRVDEIDLPFEVKKIYRKTWETILPPKIFLLLFIFLLIMFMLQGETTPNTYMLLKINVFQFLRWKN